MDMSQVEALNKPWQPLKWTETEKKIILELY